MEARPGLTALSAAGGRGEGADFDLGRVAGVITLGTGLREDGDRQRAITDLSKRIRSAPKNYGGCDSATCTRALAEASIPLMMVAGLADTTVDPSSSSAIFEMAAPPKAAVWFQGADHHMRSRFDEVVALLAQWIPVLHASPAVAVPQGFFSEEPRIV